PPPQPAKLYDIVRDLLYVPLDVMKASLFAPPGDEPAAGFVNPKLLALPEEEQTKFIEDEEDNFTKEGDGAKSKARCRGTVVRRRRVSEVFEFEGADGELCWESGLERTQRYMDSLWTCKEGWYYAPAKRMLYGMIACNVWRDIDFGYNGSGGGVYEVDRHRLSRGVLTLFPDALADMFVAIDSSEEARTLHRNSDYHGYQDE
ncbi:hypothetical protein HK097_010479, partial [Rhizophlyctis rosea]